ncbi:MAG: type I restriction-modification enzyme R subunit C-terminal domain-containing protein, partial [Alkaliphilus sp.]
RVVATATALEGKGSIQQVKRQQEVLSKIQTDEYWEEADILEHEAVRIALRDLIKFLDSQQTAIYYTNFADEVIETKEGAGEYSVNDMQGYKKKVDRYLSEHQNDIVVYKLRNNKEISEEDVKHLEKILWQELGTKEDYRKEYGDEPLLQLVIKIVGLDPKAANVAFNKFLSDESLNYHQMEFVKLIVNFIIKNGIIDKNVLTEHPFSKYGTVVNLFEGKIEVAKGLINVIDEINARGKVASG